MRYSVAMRTWLSPRRLLVAAAIALLVVSAGAIVLSLITWDSPRLGAAVLTRVGAMAGIELSAQDFRLNLLRGLELRGVRVRCPLEAGHLEATTDRLLLEHRLLPLLSGKVVVDQLVLERPEISLVSNSTTASATTSSPPETTAASATPGESQAATGLQVELTRISMTDATLVVRDEALPSPLVDLRGLDLELRDLRLDAAATSVLAGVSAQGELSAESAVLDVITAQDLRGAVRLADGHFVLHELDLPANLGSFYISELDVDLLQDPYTFDVALVAEPLAADQIVGAIGKTLGLARLELATSGGLGDSFDLRGKGTLSLSVGKLPDTPVLAALDELLRGLPLVGAAYQPFDIHFALEGDSIVADLFQITTPDVLLAAQGAVGLDQSLDLRFVAKAARELLAETDIPPEVLEALTDADGLVNVPLLVRGDRDNPRAAFDRSQWSSMARERIRREAEREVEKQAGKALGRLLGRDRD
jgi:hypothetical protein